MKAVGMVNVHEAQAAVSTLLRFLGYDDECDGLRDTPRRVVAMFREMTAGEKQSPGEVLSTTFESSYDQMVVVRDVPFWSLCEHHMVPFHGTATIGYIPQPEGRVVGLSKLARLLHIYARRLQLQERMTQQVANAIESTLEPLGVGVVVRARHLCMEMRGVKTPGTTVTSCLLGYFKDRADARAEFMALARNGGAR